MKWAALLQYYLECLRREDGFEELLPRSQTGIRYVFAKSGKEQLLSAPEQGLQVTEFVRELANSAVLRGETLYYGYPAFVQIDTSSGARQRKVGCLLAIELALPAAGEVIPGRLMPKSDEPFLHPTVMSVLGFRGEQVSEFLKKNPLDRVMGSREALAESVAQLVAALEVATHEPINPHAMSAVPEEAIDGEGLHNVAIVFRGSSSEYNRRLLEELTTLRDKGDEAARTAAGALLGVSEVIRGGAHKDCELVCPIAANEAQRKALQGALTEPVTVVTGPPGTGKSQLVTNIVASAWAAQQSVLVVSTNNRAVDVACRRSQEIHPGMVIRTGSKEYREKARETLDELRKRPGAVADLEAIRLSLRTLRERGTRLRQQLDERTRLETRQAEIVLGQDVLRAGTGWPSAEHLAALRKATPTRQLARAVRRVLGARVLRTWRLRRLGRRLAVDLGIHGQSVGRFLELEVEREEGLARLETLPTMVDLVSGLVAIDAQGQEVSAEYVKALVGGAAAEGWQAIGEFVNARVVRGRNGLAIAFPPLAKHLRGWASTALSAGATLPLKAGLVDLLVVDEASQCSIPQIIPLMYRAKRVVVIGDAQQLAHITRLRASEERVLASDVGLDADDLEEEHLLFSRSSLFDCLKSRVGHAHLLDEHYRSHPQIIELSNREFYGGQLSVLTDPARLVECGPQAVAWMDVVGKSVRPHSGSAVNPIEAEAVANAVRELARKYKARTIGVVTPFSAQARLIQTLVEERISEDARTRAALVVGTAHAFQGDERDIMVFSPVVTPELAPSSIAWLTGTPSLFNVAITRARSYLLVVGHLRYCLELKGPLGELARYSEELRVEKVVQSEGSAGRVHSEAEARLLKALLRAGLAVRSKQIVRGYECDFVVEGKKSIVNIECDGRHHVDEAGRLRLQDQARDALIRHQGWTVIRVPAWRCLAEPEMAVREVVAALGE